MHFNCAVFWVFALMFNFASFATELTFDQFIKQKSQLANQRSLNLERIGQEYQKLINEDPQIIELTDQLLDLLKRRNVEVKDITLSPFAHAYGSEEVSTANFRKALKESIDSIKKMPRRKNKLQVNELVLTAGKDYQSLYGNHTITFPINSLQWTAMLSADGIKDKRYQEFLRQEKAAVLQKILAHNRVLSAAEKADVITKSLFICSQGDQVQDPKSHLRYLSHRKGEVARDVYVTKLKQPSDDLGTVSLILSLDEQCRITGAKVQNYTRDTLSELSEWGAMGEEKSRLVLASPSKNEEECADDEEESSGPWFDIKKIFSELTSRPMKN